MSTLPPFLQRLPPDPTIQETCVNAAFPHPKLGTSAHALWWPANVEQPRVVLMMIPGNPGVVGFYTPFLAAIHEKADRKIAILAHGHLGHSPIIAPSVQYKDDSSKGLTVQVESAIEAAQALHDTYPQAQLAIVGHSMGCWVALQVLSSRPDIVSSLFLLAPTISHIVQTPNGRSYAWLFRAPFRNIVASLSVFTRILPLPAFHLCLGDWPLPQLKVVRQWLKSRSAVYACLILADQEMKTIRDVDATLLQEHKHRLHMFFVEEDHWVGEQKDAILRVFDADPGSVKVIHGHADIPHNFCTNHGETLAEQCFEWLQAGGML